MIDYYIMLLTESGIKIKDMVILLTVIFLRYLGMNRSFKYK